MNDREIKHFIKLINEGVLTSQAVVWLNSRGYSVICSGGKVVAIELEEQLEMIGELLQAQLLGGLQYAN